MRRFANPKLSGVPSIGMSTRPPADDVVQSVLGRDGAVDAVVRLTALQHGGAVAAGEGNEDALSELGAAADLVDKVARHAYRVTDEDVEAARAAGWADHDLFDVVVATSVGAGVTRRALGRAAVDRWERSR
jgi:alkylhydroperoxidase family enzyme